MASATEKNGTMSKADAEILVHYRKSCKGAKTHKAKVQGVKIRIRELMESIGELEAARKEAKTRYQQSLARHVAGDADESVVKNAKKKLASAEAALAEAEGILEALEGELPKLQAAAPNSTEIEHARRAAWDAISRDLKAQVPNKINELAAKIYAATLTNHPDAAFSVALTAICPTPPARQYCAKWAEQLAEEYDIPVD